MTVGSPTNEYTIETALSAIAGRRITAAALAAEFYARIKREDAAIGAFLTLSEDLLLFGLQAPGDLP